MESFWAQLRAQLTQSWSKMNTTQKIVIFVAIAAIISTIVVLGKLAAKPDMLPLFTNLNSADAGAIINRLDDLKTPYQLSDGGTTILVPNKDKDRLRIQLAMDDLPRRGVVGFESWSETRFGETDTDKRVRMLVALQGELTRTIESLEEVEAARVHIAIPEPKLFTADTSETTASIMVQLSPFAQLDASQVAAIMRLVANSVEELKPEEVVVVDTYMNILSEGIAESSTPTLANLTTNQLQLKEQFENNLAKSIQTMLEQPWGHGRVVVRVSADLNFDEVERKTQLFGNNVVRSESFSEETSKGSSPIVGGEVGLEANEGLVERDVATSEYEQSENIRNYEIDVIEEYIKESPGAINRLSVSVIVDTGEEAELSEDLVNNIRRAVASAAGIIDNRNDNVEVIGLPFNTKGFEQMQSQMEEYRRQTFIRQVIMYSLVGGIILIIAGLIIRAVRSNKRTSKQQRQFEQVVEQQTQLSPEEKERDLMKKQIENLANEKPSEVAHLLKTWLVDDSR